MSGPYEVTRQFEEELCRYTGAPYAVALNSCSAAIMLACEWCFTFLPSVRATGMSGADRENNVVTIPSRTYVSVPQAIIRAGGNPRFRDYSWSGAYRIEPLPVFDCARRFTSGMYRAGEFQCVSFAAAKILGIEQGGAILHDNEKADLWLRRMRFDGRTPGVDPSEDTFDLCGHHVIMLPSVAAQAIVRLHHLPKHNEDQAEYEYPDLSKHPAFR